MSEAIKIVKLSACYIVEEENNIFFVMSLKSVLNSNIFDEIIIIDNSHDGTLELIDSFNDRRIKVIHNRFQHESKGANGRQRNEYLKWVTGDWVLVLDADEILSDDAYKLREYAESGKFNVYDIKMLHFIYSLKWVDATSAGNPLVKDENHVHRVLHRFFKMTPNVFYPELEHPVLSGFEGEVGIIDDVEIYHMGYMKGIQMVFDKYNLNMAKSNMHNAEFLKAWYKAHVNGTYPVKEINSSEINSYLLKELMEGEVPDDILPTARR